MSEQELIQEIKDLKQIQYELSAELVNKNKNIDHLLKENARLREALEFYADEKNWYYELNSNVVEDGGDNARQALEAESNESTN